MLRLRREDLSTTIRCPTAGLARVEKLVSWADARVRLARPFCSSLRLRGRASGDARDYGVTSGIWFGIWWGGCFGVRTFPECMLIFSPDAWIGIDERGVSGLSDVVRSSIDERLSNSVVQ